MLLFGRRRRHAEVWRNAHVFHGFDRDELDFVGSILERRQVEGGEYVVREGEPGRELLLVVSGAFAISKRSSSQEHAIYRAGPGELIGAAALIDGGPVSASARALERSEILALPFGALEERRHDGRKLRALRKAVRQKLVLGLAQVLSHRIRDKNEQFLAGVQARAAMGEFIVKLLILLCLYVLLLNGLGPRLPNNSTAISIPLQLAFGLVSWRFIRTSGYPLRVFGISLSNFLTSLIEAAVFTVPFLLALTGLKWLLLSFNSALETNPVIEHPDVMLRLSQPKVVFWFGVYALSSIVQELIVRGALQSSLEMFLVGKRRVEKAVLASALLFSVTHLHLSFLFAVLAFLPGLLWGILYSRRKNLAGVTLSHIAVGGYVFFILGVNIGG
jgi:hypothetical protein